MDKETIIIASEDVEIIDASEYKEELSEHFGRVPEVAKPLLKGAKTVFAQIPLYVILNFTDIIINFVVLMLLKDFGCGSEDLLKYQKSRRKAGFLS